MQTPIVLLVGQAGSGKDTVASFMVKNHGAVAIAQADPMKRLVRQVFGFNDDQLWGPSAYRNAPDARYDDQTYWSVARAALGSPDVEFWLEDVFDTKGGVGGAWQALRAWFNQVEAQTFLSRKQLTPRFVLQTLGTEWGRAQSRHLWTDYAVKAAYELLSGGYRYDRAHGLVPDPEYAGPALVAITDGRFRNELVNVLRVGGSVVRIDSPDADGSTAEKAGVAGHRSETEQRAIPEHFFTRVFLNDKAKGLEACEAATAELVQGL